MQITNGIELIASASILDSFATHDVGQLFSPFLKTSLGFYLIVSFAAVLVHCRTCRCARSFGPTRFPAQPDPRPN